MTRKYTPKPATSRWNNPWTDDQKALLEQMAAIKRPWEEIALRTGHPRMSCQCMLSYIRRGRKRPPGQEGRILHALARDTRQAPTFDETQFIAEPSTRRRSLHTLIADAELRGRIETLGPTGGLLGDPLPGRSALDRKRENA